MMQFEKRIKDRKLIAKYLSLMTGDEKHAPSSISTLDVIWVLYEKILNITPKTGNDSNLLIVFYVQIMPDDFVMQLHRF